MAVKINRLHRSAVKPDLSGRDIRLRYDVAREMEGGSLESFCRERLQTNTSKLLASKAPVVSVEEKSHYMRQVWIKKVSTERTNVSVEDR